MSVVSTINSYLRDKWQRGERLRSIKDFLTRKPLDSDEPIRAEDIIWDDVGLQEFLDNVEPDYESFSSLTKRR